MHNALLFFLFPLLAALASGDNGTHPIPSRIKRSSGLAFNPQRIQLLKDALGWMTFRKDGQLMTEAQWEPLFLETLMDKYRSSNFYRTFVIAFQHGVLPRLTLQENDDCDPGYTSEYKNPYNSSVTWFFQKRFTFDKYDNRYRGGSHFCDYRQGLVCKSPTNKCGCPDGAAMEAIDKGSSVKRCLLQENEACTLIDLAHGRDPKHSALSSNLYHMIFNLEKPLSCKIGTQCRFKYPNLAHPKCYDVNSGPWAPPYTDSDGNKLDGWRMQFGSTCTPGLWASPGSCDEWPRSDRVGLIPYGCYDFGPPRSLKTSGQSLSVKEGFCVNQIGSYGLVSHSVSSVSGLTTFPVLFIGHVHPRTVPLRGSELKDYYQTYLGYNLYEKLRNHPGQSVGDICSVAKTKMMEDVWRYYAGLEETPPAGEDYVAGATKAELDAKLETLSDLVKSPGAWCKVYWHFSRSSPGSWLQTYPSLKCVAEGTADGDGNDGKCQKPGNIDDQEYAKMIQEFKEVTGKADNEMKEGEKIYRRDILKDNPEATCSPNLVAPQARSHNHAEVLEGGYCPEGYVCYEDYSDGSGIYNSYCEAPRIEEIELKYVCHESRDGIDYGSCEGKYLEVKLATEFEKMVNISHLSRGKACRHDLEKDIQQWIRNGRSWKDLNKYKMLWLIWRKGSTGEKDDVGGFCNRAGFVECSEQDVCECLEGTETRKVTVDGVEYQSDYCYLASGSCDSLETLGYRQVKFTENERKASESHYVRCANSCVFRKETGECTTENTGKTGYDLKPEPTTPAPVPYPQGPDSAGGPGWRHVGGAADLHGSWMVTGWGLASSLVLIRKMIRFGFGAL